MGYQPYDGKLAEALANKDLKGKGFGRVWFHLDKQTGIPSIHVESPWWRVFWVGHWEHQIRGAIWESNVRRVVLHPRWTVKGGRR